jgi:hypothetical protein
VQRTVEGGRAGDARVTVHIGEVGVPLVAELGQDHEDPVGAFPGELHVLVLAAGGLADLGDDASVAVLGLDRALEDPVDGLLAQGPPLGFERADLVVLWGPDRSGLHGRRRYGHGRESDPDAGDHRGAE